MRHVFLAALLAAVWASPARAQQKISEEQFLKALTEDHPALQAESDRLGAAGGDLRRARSLGNPLLEFAREAPDDNPRVTNWTLSWTPPLDGRRGPRVGAARAGVLAAESDFAARRLQIRRDLREFYASWALSVERRNTIRSQMDRIQRLAVQMKDRAVNGEESPLAARRMELAVLELRAQMIQAEAGVLKSAAIALAWWPAEAAPPFEPELPELPGMPDSLLAEGKPDLAALRHEMEQAHQLSRAGGRFFRFPEISLGWQRLQEADRTLEGPLVGVALSLPLFDRDQGDRYEARMRVTAARSRMEMLSRRAQSELAGGLAAYDRLRTGAAESRAAVDGVDRVNDGAAASFRLGESNLTDLLETYRSTLAARLAALDLYAAALAAHRDLEIAVGRPLSPNGGSR